MKYLLIVLVTILFAVIQVHSWTGIPSHISTSKLYSKPHNGRIVKSRTLSSLSDNQQPHFNSEVHLKKSSNSVLSTVKSIWDFTRPHTIIGSCISLVSLYLFAIPSKHWHETRFIKSLFAALIPSLFMNLYITGLNQVTDIEIDRINKPYLPLASGKLSKTAGIWIVLISLMMSLINYNNMEWPLQMTLMGSAFLGTIYSLPPFRLKRFPLLAAFCILVVRGSLINLGFFMQAKASVLGEILFRPNLSILSLLSFFKQVLSNYPEAIIITSFFVLFGVVIALMKDVPDIKGDVQYKIPSFSVQLGAKKMFTIAWKLLFTLLLSASACVLVHSTGLIPYIPAAIRKGTTSTLLHPIPVPVVAGLSASVSSSSAASTLWARTAAQLARFLPALRFTTPIAPPTATITQNAHILAPVTTMTSRIAHTAVSCVLGLLAWDVQQRAQQVDPDQPKQVFAYYMHIWNIFYVCYLLLPLLRV